MKKLLLLIVLPLFFACKKEEIKPYNSNESIHEKVIGIGSWNMDETLYINVSHGLDFSKIVSISVLITDDSNGIKSSLTFGGDVNSIDVNSITMFRRDSGYYDNSGYSNPSINRGYITIKYID